MAATPVAIKRPLKCEALRATFKHSNTIAAKSKIVIQLPINPNSSPITEKIKSVCCSEIKLPPLTEVKVLLLYPLQAMDKNKIAALSIFEDS